MFVGRQQIVDRLVVAVPRNYSDLMKSFFMCYRHTHWKFPKLAEESRRHVLIFPCILFVGHQHAVTLFS